MMVPRGYSCSARSHCEEKIRRTGGNKSRKRAANTSSSGSDKGLDFPDFIKPTTRTTGQRPKETALKKANQAAAHEKEQCGSSPSISPWLGAPMRTKPSPVVIKPRMATSRSSTSTQPRRFCGKPVSSSSPHSWGVLLTPPPEETEMEIGSIGSDTTLDGSSFVRSMSKDSMTSLEDDSDVDDNDDSNDDAKSASSLSAGSPCSRRKNSLNNEMRQGWVNRSFPEDCLTDHPLMSPILDSKMKPDVVEYLVESPISMARLSKFKSNLTASFRAISSAAKSISNMTTPALRQDEYLTRSLLSISTQLTDERRPATSNQLPDPALRRYLNPTPSSMSPAEFYAYRNETRHVEGISGPWKASIQLQTCHRRPPPSRVATMPPLFQKEPVPSSLDESSTTTVAAPRQRETRENGDFLRIIVLEMNMRRKGRLKEIEPGRARLWLPPRQVHGMNLRKEEGCKVPKRWIGITA